MISTILLERLNEFQQNGILCDLSVFTKDGERFLVHSCVFAAACQAQFNLFINKKQTEPLQNVVLYNIDSKDFKVVLDAIYGRTATINRHLLILLEKLGMDNLVTGHEFVEEDIKVEQASDQDTVALQEYYSSNSARETYTEHSDSSTSARETYMEPSGISISARETETVQVQEDAECEMPVYNNNFDLSNAVTTEEMSLSSDSIQETHFESTPPPSACHRDSFLTVKKLLSEPPIMKNTEYNEDKKAAETRTQITTPQTSDPPQQSETPLQLLPQVSIKTETLRNDETVTSNIGREHTTAYEAGPMKGDEPDTLLFYPVSQQAVILNVSGGKNRVRMYLKGMWKEE